GAQLEAPARRAGLGLDEAPADADGARALEEHPLDRRAGDDRAAARHDLGDVVEVRALLALGAAALEALALAEAVLDVAAHHVAIEAEGAVGDEGQLVRATQRLGRHLGGVQLAL